MKKNYLARSINIRHTSNTHMSSFSLQCYRSNEEAKNAVTVHLKIYGTTNDCSVISTTTFKDLYEALLEEKLLKGQRTNTFFFEQQGSEKKIVVTVEEDRPLLKPETMIRISMSSRILEHCDSKTMIYFMY
uniref:Uncharacterized protein n=1 Tax=viral metagenome TaxID=1070528 RepID=A0A6C0C898_9ZZZZ